LRKNQALAFRSDEIFRTGNILSFYSSVALTFSQCSSNLFLTVLTGCKCPPWVFPP
jgi:hypothetical protein